MARGPCVPRTCALSIPHPETPPQPHHLAAHVVGVSLSDASWHMPRPPMTPCAPASVPTGTHNGGDKGNPQLSPCFRGLMLYCFGVS